MFKEICEQPAVLERLYALNEKTFRAIAAEVKKRGVTQITMAARGSSDNACNYFKYLEEIYCGLPVSFAAPSVISLYNGKLKFVNSLVIGVSQSGKAADALEVLARAKANGAVTVSITNNTDSPMAAAADYHIDLGAGPELSVAATKTFSAQMYALALLAAELSGDAELKKTLAGVPAAVQKTVNNAESIALAARALKDNTDCFVLSRGLTYAVAQETALKIQETTYIKARCYAASDFHHGPFAMVDDKTTVILLMPSDVSDKDMTEMEVKLRNAGARLIIFSDKPVTAPCAAVVTVAKAEDAALPFCYAVSAQLFANALSIARNLNPDAPRGLNKVTITK
jgi:glucosamine--fructose-6-phosphate aminotransferase (isomerizing)